MMQARGNIDIAENEVHWTVSGFHENFRFSIALDSPNFHTCGEKWNLTLYPPCSSGSVWYEIILCQLSDFNNQMFHVRLGILDVSCKEILSACAKRDGCRFKVDKFIRKSDLLSGKERMLQKGNLHLFCKIQKKEDAFENETESKAAIETEVTNIQQNKEDILKKDCMSTKGVGRLIKNLKSLFLNGYNSDVILEAGGRQFPVHKSILVARSSTFSSMFRHDVKEKFCGVVYIPDCTAEAFEIFLLYLYTGNVHNISCGNVFNLYYSADKYCIDDLKSECIEFMRDNLSLDIFCDVMTLSLKNTDSGLFQACVSFFCKCYKKIIKTGQWQNYVSEHPIEANELFIKAVNA